MYLVFFEDEWCFVSYRWCCCLLSSLVIRINYFIESDVKDHIQISNICYFFSPPFIRIHFSVARNTKRKIFENSWHHVQTVVQTFYSIILLNWFSFLIKIDIYKMIFYKLFIRFCKCRVILSELHSWFIPLKWETTLICTFYLCMASSWAYTHNSCIVLFHSFINYLLLQQNLWCRLVWPFKGN